MFLVGASSICLMKGCARASTSFDGVNAMRTNEVFAAFMGFVIACGMFSICYWAAGQLDGTDVSLFEAALWSLPTAGLGFVLYSGAGWRGLLAWLFFLFTAVFAFQYWFLSMSDFFSIGSRVVYDQGFTSVGVAVLILVPVGVTALCGISVFFGRRGQLLFVTDAEAPQF